MCARTPKGKFATVTQERCGETSPLDSLLADRWCHKMTRQAAQKAWATPPSWRSVLGSGTPPAPPSHSKPPSHTHTHSPPPPPPGQRAWSPSVQDKQCEGMWAQRLANTELHGSIAGQTEAVARARLNPLIHHRCLFLLLLFLFLFYLANRSLLQN